MNDAIGPAVAERQRKVLDALADVVTFFEAAQRMECLVEPDAELRAMCERLAALRITDNKSLTREAVDVPEAPVAGPTATKPVPTRKPTTPKKSLVKSGHGRGPGNRSPAGTVTNLIRQIIAERPGQVLAARDLADWLVERGWERPIRPGHSINLAMTRLSAKEGSGVSRVGAGLWRYDEPAPTSSSPGAARPGGEVVDVTAEPIRQLFVRREDPDATTMIGVTADAYAMTAAGTH
ncbi:hypothetical protein [Nocardia sp. SSK8]|uniref:hypothetical protein n=1 Tax=Nocardia sp. SSK8 TaxID=3120154 RepID=UPI003008321F